MVQFIQNPIQLPVSRKGLFMRHYWSLEINLDGLNLHRFLDLLQLAQVIYTIVKMLDRKLITIFSDMDEEMITTVQLTFEENIIPLDLTSSSCKCSITIYLIFLCIIYF